eukprot:390273-Pelagomonas_calceolata.AAC.8
MANPDRNCLKASVMTPLSWKGHNAHESARACHDAHASSTVDEGKPKKLTTTAHIFPGFNQKGHAPERHNSSKHKESCSSLHQRARLLIWTHSLCAPRVKLELQKSSQLKSDEPLASWNHLQEQLEFASHATKQLLEILGAPITNKQPALDNFKVAMKTMTRNASALAKALHALGTPERTETVAHAHTHTHTHTPVLALTLHALGLMHALGALHALRA